MGYKHQSPQELTETNKSIYGEESFNMKNFTVGAIVGALAGAAIALLYAPKPGTALRQDVASQALSLKDKSVELSSVAKEKTAHLSSQLKEQSSQLVDKVKAKSSKDSSDASDEGTVQGESSIKEVVVAVDETISDLTAGISQKADATIEELLEDTKV
jgi:gas vesicle protein